ncbi:MAG: hypothetical protein HY362_04105 [Candidatus Aenigmarchaeota archaeon]|nr:hypothetical protein [Candidatus Aenigmarchaeota archaeon]
MKEQVSALARAALSRRQLLVLQEAFVFDRSVTASSFVRTVSEKHGFSETSVWHSMRKFRRLGFLEYGNGSVFLRVTEFGRVLKNGGEKNGR